MIFLLIVLAFFAFFFGLGYLTFAKSALHEIEAFILFLIFAVCVPGAGIIASINRLRKDVLVEAKQPSLDFHDTRLA